MWVIFFYSIYSFLNDILIQFNIAGSENKYTLYSLYTIVEYSCMAYLFYKLITNITVKWILLSCSVLFLIFAFYGLFRAKARTFDSISVSIEAILLLAFCVYYLFERVKNSNSLFIYTTYQFWITVALMIYFAGTFFLFIYAQNYFDNANFFNTYSLINATFYILKNILFSVAFSVKEDNTNYPIIPSK